MGLSDKIRYVGKYLGKALGTALFAYSLLSSPASADFKEIYNNQNNATSVVYHVEKGDNLSKIAKEVSNKYGINITYADILSANPSIKDKNLISIGQVLNIPVSISKSDNNSVDKGLESIITESDSQILSNVTVIPDSVPKTSTGEYQIRKGQTLFGIAKEISETTGNQITYKELAEYNNIKNPSIIHAGNILKYPLYVNDSVKPKETPEVISKSDMPTVSYDSSSILKERLQITSDDIIKSESYNMSADIERTTEILKGVVSSDILSKDVLQTIASDDVLKKKDEKVAPLVDLEAKISEESSLDKKEEIPQYTTITHTIVRGNTLLKIANMYGADIKDVRSGCLYDERALPIGKTITFKVSNAPRTASTVQSRKPRLESIITGSGKKDPKAIPETQWAESFAKDPANLDGRSFVLYMDQLRSSKKKVKNTYEGFHVGRVGTLDNLQQTYNVNFETLRQSAKDLKIKDKDSFYETALAIMGAESKGLPYALSFANCFGIYQLGRDVCGSHRQNGKVLPAINPFNQTQATQRYAEFMNHLMNRYGKYKDERILFLAYNQGETRVSSAIGRLAAEKKPITYDNLISLKVKGKHFFSAEGRGYAGKVIGNRSTIRRNFSINFQQTVPLTKK